ncbi:ATP-binding protein [Streptomyces himalayensis]|uniref:ATP-binding protein n=1 Tax=Streptomyces himalayensis TaxID=2820085 RepID=UPI002867EC1C|nr:ATP-binding protein [Streptomyces himalayensis]
MAELLATELVSNAVRHTKGPAALRLCWRDGVLRIGTWDADPKPPSPVPEPAHGVDAETGRGLELVRACADDWGWHPLAQGGDRGKYVWCDLGAAWRVDPVWVDTDEGSFLLVLEAQGKKDEAKRGSWAYYLSYLYAKYRCEPVLIVMSQSSSTARWAARPIRLGLPGWTSLMVRPLVLGPDNVPVITDEKEVAQDVSLAVFSAITHGRGPGVAAILRPLAVALETVDPDSAAVFAQLVESGLVDDQAKKIWRELMMPVNYFFRHPVAEKVREEGIELGVEKGVEKERASMVLRILDWRGIEVPESVRERVTACTDLDRLDAWAQRAVHATSATELFDGDGA